MSLADLLKLHADHPGFVLAYEVDELREFCLSLFQVEPGTMQLGFVTVRREEKSAIDAELGRRELAAGSYASMTGLVWFRRGRAFYLHGSEGRLFQTDGVSLDFQNRCTALEAGMRVAAYVADDLIRRGVRIVSPRGEYTVAEHTQLRASVDWSYGALDALSDSGWTVYLGSDLAEFLGIPFEDGTGSP